MSILCLCFDGDSITLVASPDPIETSSFFAPKLHSKSTIANKPKKTPPTLKRHGVGTVPKARITTTRTLGRPFYRENILKSILYIS